MRKILSLFAAVLVALVANSAVININTSTEHALRLALNSAATGDVIEMAAGTYNESGDYLAFTGKEVTVRAAEGAEVIIKPVCPVRLKEGAKAEFINVKFDCSAVGSYDYVIVAADDTDNKRVVLTGCEFYGWTKNKAMIEATSARRLAAITIDKCYFHDCTKSVVFVENTGTIALSVTNSTFANIATDASSFYAGVIDSRATAGSLLVDHCTFYNVQVMNTDYAAVGKVSLASGAVVSNCIFMLPESTSGVRAIRDAVAANNCLVYNYANDGGWGMQSAVVRNAACINDQNPLFVDAANANYTLGANSPALTAASDGGAIGDPRWVPAAPATPEYYLVGTMNNWTEADAYKFIVNPANDAEYMLETTLAEGDSLKVKSDMNVWFPDNQPNYIVDAAHAGAKTVYFRPDGQGGNDWYHGVIYIAANAPAPEPATPVYSYTHIKNGSNSAYNTAYDVTVNEMQWSVMANLATDASTRFGGKSLTAVDKPMYTKQPMAAAIDSIVIRHLGCTSDKLKVNSIKVEVASDAAFANLLDTITLTPNIGKNDTNTVTIALTNAVANSYYRITYNLTNSQSTNYAFQVTRIDFYGQAAPAPVEVNYYMKNNWGAGADWSWKEMTKDGETYKLDSVVFGGNGVNYNTAASDEGAVWVPAANILGATIAAKDTVSFVLNPADSTVTATLIGKYVEPVVGCDWANIEFLGNGTAVEAYTNCFKICKENAQWPNVVNIQQPAWATAPGIYMSFPSADWTAITPLTSADYDIDGAGIVLHVAAFTAVETEVTVTIGTTPYVFTVYNKNGVVPAPDYYLKNNWDAAADWTWKQMTKDGETYKLDSVVFGGTGVNYNTAAADAGSVWVELAKFHGDTIAAKDTVRLVLNPADSTITATLLGKYIEPAPVIPMDLWKVVAATDTARGAVYVDNENIKVETVYRGTVVATGANYFDKEFTHVIQVRVAAWPTAEVPTGTEQANCTPLVITAKKDANVKFYYIRQAVNKAWTANDNKDAWIFDQAAPTTAMTAVAMDGVLAAEDSSYYNVVKEMALQAGHTYTFAAKGTTLKLYGIEYPAGAPVPVKHTYTVAGGSDVAFGQTWAPADTLNDMTLAEGDSLYRWEKAELLLAAGNIDFKVCEDHAWTVAYPAQNYSLAIAESGIYTVKITFNPETKAVAAEAIKTGEAVVIPTIKMHGNFTGSWKNTDLFALAADSLTASLKMDIAAGNYEFGMRIGGDGNWTSNGAQFTRENPSAKVVAGSGNLKLAADVAGEYTFTWFFANDSLAIAYPKIIPHYNVAEAIAAADSSLLAKNDEVYVRGIITKMEFKGTNFKKYGSVNIYVADVTGAAGEFEFYNCYSLEADTFRASSPAYDPASAAWAQFLSVTDGNGKTVTVGDTVEAFGKYTKYNSTYELNTGCYITEIKKGPAKWENPIDTTKFFTTASWAVDTLSTATWDAVNQKVIVNIIPGKEAQWQGQLWLKLPMEVRAGYEYDLAFTIKANKTFAGTIVKYQENAEMLIDWDLALTADQAVVYEKKNLRGLANGNGVLVIDFGFAPDSTLIEIYNMSIIEHESTQTPAKFYVTGNDAFTVDAGLTTAKSWNPDAFKSETDTFTVALKAGAEYQLKVCVDGSWNTVKGYNDLTEKTPGIIDADGNNHNIGFSLVEDGNVMIIYTGEVFKVVGNFVTEDIDNIYDAEKAVKVLRDGQIFILRGDKVYTVMGQPVK